MSDQNLYPAMPMDEDEEYMDYNCPTGKLIKKLEEKSKKPIVIDDSLGKILDEFSEITSVQDRYLVNGIFQVDFAQSALFLQSSSIYYAKRVDKLWDELLELHTRLVQYDHHHAKEIKDRSQLEAGKNELHKIEERVNKGRRKKVQLVEVESTDPLSSTPIDVLQDIFGDKIVLGDEDDEDTKQSKLPFEADEDLIKGWKKVLEAPRNKLKKVSKAVWEHGHQTYKLNNYEIFGNDFHIMDLDDDEEFNVKYSNAPTYHLLKHLFEYNDRCLLPDQQNTIATLRLGYSLTNKYLADNHIPLGTPYEVYKEGYERFVSEYYQKEKRRIQNLPQSSSEDVQNFYKILMHREKEALQAKTERKRSLSSAERMVEPSVTFLSLIEAPLCDNELRMIRPTFESECSDAEVSGLLEGKEKDGSENRLDSGVMTMDRSLNSTTSGFFSNDEENHNETAQTVEKEGENRDVSANESGENVAEATEQQNNENAPEGTQNEATDKQFRSDSGFFDTGFETDDEDEGDDNVENIGDSTPPENGENSLNCAQKNGEGPQDCAQAENGGKVAENGENVAKNNEDEANNENAEHMEDPILESVEDTENDQNHINKPQKREKLQEKRERKPREEPKLRERIIKRKIIENFDDEDDDVPLKRRKLTLKAIEKLSKSLVGPVKEMKWEKFFSMMYEPEVGEGTVEEVTYESDPEPEPEPIPTTILMPPPPSPRNRDEPTNREMVIPTPPPPSDAYHSDHDYATLPSPARSECPSDHDYAMPPPCVGCNGNGEACDKCRVEEDDIGGGEGIVEEEREDETREDGIEEFVRRVENDWDNIIRDEIATPLKAKEYGPLTKAEQELKDFEEERAQSRKRVEEWKERIMPILKKKKDQEFDIHEYGTKIMEGMEMNQTKKFGDFVGGKQPSEVARFFVSVLQLANTNNIEIGGAKKGEFSNDSFSLKLLSRERYHEHLNEFMAPSEESFRDRLEKVKQMNRHVAQTTLNRLSTASTPTSTQPPIKKLKIVLNREAQTPASRRIDFAQVPSVKISPIKRSGTQESSVGPQMKKLRIVVQRSDAEGRKFGTYGSEDSGLGSGESEMSLSQRSGQSDSVMSLSQRSESEMSLSQPSTSRGIPGIDFEVSPSQQMGPPQPIFDDVMSWKLARIQRRRSSTSDSGIMRSPICGVSESPGSEDYFRDNLRVSLDGAVGRQSTPRKEFCG